MSEYVSDLQSFLTRGSRSVEKSRNGWGDGDARAACVKNSSVAARAGRPEDARLWSICAQETILICHLYSSRFFSMSISF